MKTPQIIKNRWIRLVSVSACVWFFTTWYYGWQYLYRFLLADGTYSWLCDECDSSYIGWNAEYEVCVAPADAVDADGNSVLYVCLEQDNAVQAIYTIMSSSEFCGGIVAGLLYDLVGYRLMTLIGIALNLIGSFGLAFSSKTIPLYYFAAICGGGSTNIICFAGYYVKELFPGRASFVLNLNFATQWAGSAVMMLLWELSDEGNKKLSFLHPIFSLIGLPFFLLFLLTVPKNRQEFAIELEAKKIPVMEEVRPGKVKDLLTIYKQWDIPLYCLGCYLPIVLANNAYITCASTIGGADLGLFLGRIQLYQPLIQIGFALFAAISKTSMVIFWAPFVVTYIGGLIGLLSLVTGVDNQGWLNFGSVVFVIANTFVYASKYIICLPMIDPALYGMTTGSMATASGALQMTNILWRQLAVNNGGTEGLVGFIWGYIVVGCLLSTVCITIVAWRFTNGKLHHLMYIVSAPPKEGLEALEHSGSSSDEDKAHLEPLQVQYSYASYSEGSTKA